MRDKPIATFLLRLGISGVEPQAAARAVLEEAGLTSSRKTNMAVSKQAAAQDALEARLAFHCASVACQKSLRLHEDQSPTPRDLLLVEKQFCVVCGGSNDRTALEEMAHALRDAGLCRVVVVGGTDAKFAQIREHSPAGIEWRFVDGLNNVNETKAKADLKWGDVIIIWGGTPLPHRVSGLYSSASHAKVANATGITTLAREAARFAREQAQRRRR